MAIKVNKKYVKKIDTQLLSSLHERIIGNVATDKKLVNHFIKTANGMALG